MNNQELAATARSANGEAGPKAEPLAASQAAPAPHGEHEVLRIRDISFADATALLARYALRLELVADKKPIPGSYWGDCEAGLVGSTVFVRNDTPVHSLLHEACHLVVLPPERRERVHTDATDSVEEENAVCVLQSLLAEALPGMGRDRLFRDMDAWGYTFRLGSARAYVEHDADDAWQWLQQRGLADANRKLKLPTPIRAT